MRIAYWYPRSSAPMTASPDDRQGADHQSTPASRLPLSGEGVPGSQTTAPQTGGCHMGAPRTPPASTGDLVSVIATALRECDPQEAGVESKARMIAAAVGHHLSRVAVR